MTQVLPARGRQDSSSASRKALIIVDVQEDRLPGGAIEVPGSSAIIPVIVALASRADLVIASRDVHPPDHFSFESGPVHCVHQTKGARLPSAIKRVTDYVITKGTDPNPPDAFSAFSGGTLRPLESLEDILKREHVGEVVITGLLLGWVVSQTAFDANALGYLTTVCRDATMGPDEDEAIEKLERAGIAVEESGEVWI